MSEAVTPPRPQLYDRENEARSQYQRVRYSILLEDFDGVQQDFMAETLGEDTASLFGMPDTSLNPLASQTRQLTVPGLYGRAPTRRGPPAGDVLVGPQGHMARYWPRMQQVQYFTVGTGVWFQRASVVGSGASARLVYRMVQPHNVVVWVSEDDPMEAVALWELRLRSYYDDRGQLHRLYTWDQWQLGDMHRGGKEPPLYRVVECGLNGQPGRDMSSRFIRAPGGRAGACVGPHYVWRDPATGNPFLPWLVHRALDSGEYWPSWRRNLHRGTLRACTNWTFVARSALFATGEHVLLGGVDLDAFPGVEVRYGDDNAQPGAATQLSMRVQPGTVTAVPVTPGTSMQAVTVKAGIHLPHLLDFANMYNVLLSIGDGINPSDALRQHANPTSGAALTISVQSRREFSAQVTPLFLATDLRAIWMSGTLLHLVGAGPPMFTPGLHTVEYHTIPLTPTEQADQRDQLQWEVGEGYLGPVEAYQQLHPGVDYATAFQAVVASRVEAARVQAAVQEALEGTNPDPDPDPDHE